MKDLHEQKSKSIFQKFGEHLDSFCVNCILVFILTAFLVGVFVYLTAYSTGSTSLGFEFLGFKFVIADSFINLLNNIPYLPIVAIFIPLIGGPLEAYIGARKLEVLRDSMVVNTTFVTFIVILAMYPQIAADKIFYHIPGVFGLGLNFKVDMLGFIFAVTSGVLWLMVTIYTRDYMKIERHRSRFSLWMAITFSGILGTIFAGDILTLFLFFEAMTFASYMLVAHNQSKESMLAGNNYIYMGVAGGLSILLGIVLLYVYTGTLEFIPLAAELNEIGNTKYLITMLFVIGFGIKAGMLPLHIWLPKAHPVAPTPASALLSGILIKMGAFGLLRIVTSFFTPDLTNVVDPDPTLWEVSANLGAVIIWVGIATMAVGVFMALQQSHMKKMLAYHSISQMGYIVMGIGVAAYLGDYGAMGFAGSVFHIVNHALFKGLLFMAVGLVYMRTREQDMYKLGGLWQKLPFTTFVFIVAALGITGMPGFNGFASKSMLHHAIVEAYEYGHYSFRYAEMIFTIVSAGTVCSFIKLFGYVFLGKLPEKYENIKGDNGMMDMAMGGLAVLIVAIGQAPNYFLDNFLIPSAQGFAYDSYFISNYLVGMNFFNFDDIYIMFWIYLMGAGIFIIGSKYHLFHLNMPKWMDTETSLYKPIYSFVYKSSLKITSRFELSLIKEDVIIYTIVLASALLILTRFL